MTLTAAAHTGFSASPTAADSAVQNSARGVAVLHGAGPARDLCPPADQAGTDQVRHSGSSGRPLRQNYLTLLGYMFALFSTVRVLAYLPTIWAVVQSGDSSQHSLLTWFTWAGANLKMAAWLYEQQGQRWNRAIAVNLVNASMCVATFVVIWAVRM